MEMVEGMFKGAQEPAWLEKPAFGEFRVWQVVFLCFAGFIAIIIALCCCIRFRVPRTKQQIEADYQRRIITCKFRQQLEKIQNSQMDTLDLKTALELVRVDFKTEIENEKEHSVSLISSLITPGQSSEEASFKSSNIVNNGQISTIQPDQNRIQNFSSRLKAMVQLTKLKKSPEVNLVC